MSTSQETAAGFSNEQVDFVCAVEQTWWDTGSLPTNEKINELTGINVRTIESYWKLEHVRTALLKRGVDLDQSRSTALLSLEQLNLANMLLNFHDTRSIREKLAECGVTSQQYNAWLRKPAFRDYLAHRGEELFKSSDHEAYIALTSAVRGGNMQALQMFLEMRGIYTPNKKDNVNLDVVLVRIVEVIARHVRDPETLHNIARDLEMIDMGRVGAPLQIPETSIMEQTRSDEFTI